MPRHRWEVVGERGRAVLENLTDDAVSGFRLSLASGGAATRELTIDGDNRRLPFQALAERFVAAVRAGAPCQPDFAAGARVQRLVADIDALTRGERATARR